MRLHDRIPGRVTELVDQIRPIHTALLMVDMQNDFADDEGIFVKEWGKTNRWIKQIIPQCGRLLAAARESGVAVIHLRVINDLLRNPLSWHNLEEDRYQDARVGRHRFGRLRPGHGRARFCPRLYAGVGRRRTGRR